MSIRFGWVREDTWGVFKEPTLITPVFAPRFDNAYENVLDQGVRGGSASKDFASYEGPGIIVGEVSGPAYPAVMDDWLYGIMGEAEVIANGFKYNLADSVPSFSIQIDDEVMYTGLGLRRYAGCIINSLSISSDLRSGSTSWAIGVLGRGAYWVEPYGGIGWQWAESDETWSALINIKWDGSGKWGGSFDWDEGIKSVTEPYPGWATIVQLGGQAAKALNVELNLTRDLIPQYSSSYDYPVDIKVSPLEITGKLTLLFESIADYNRYLDETQEALQITWANSSYTMNFYATKTSFADSPSVVDRSSVALALTYTNRMLYNSSDAGPGYFESVSI